MDEFQSLRSNDMQKFFILTSFMVAMGVAWANPGQYQINQACLDVGCFSGDNPATQTVEIGQVSGTFVLTSDLMLDNGDNGSPAILVDRVNNDSGVTIDLNGYAIRHSGIADGSTNGIEITGQNSVVTIKNGHIVAFNDGIQSEAGVSVVVENMVFRINRDDAIQVGLGIIRNNVFDANDYGVNSLNGNGSVAGDRVLLDSNLFIDDAGAQDAVFGFSGTNYCKDNVIGYVDAGQLGLCNLSGANLCDSALCNANREPEANKE